MSQPRKTLACPFCSCGDLQVIESVYDTGYFVICLKCDCCGPVGDSQTDAVDKWESRNAEAEVWNYGRISLDELI